MHWWEQIGSVPSVVLIVLALCVVVLTAFLVPAILTLRRAGIRAERLLGILERDVEPILVEVQGLAEQLHGLTQQVRDEVARIGAIADRARDVAERTGHVLWVLAGLTRTGQLIALAAGLRAGAQVFVRRLRRP